MDHFKILARMLDNEVRNRFNIPEDVKIPATTVEPPKNPEHGDFAANTALVSASTIGANPRKIAEDLVLSIINPTVVGAGQPETIIDNVASVDIAGPGFMNFRMDARYWHQRLREILIQGTSYGDSQMGGGEALNVEYVSANPTGPLHVGHARGAVFGDALAALMSKAGYDVTKEYYINDAGNQIDALARSLHHRYCEALGADPGPMPEGLYPGDYLIAPARALAERDQDRWLDAPEDKWLPELRLYAVDAMMALVRDDLAAMGIHQEVFTSERTLHLDGRIQDVVSELESRGQVYTGVLEPPKGKKPEDWEPRPQLLFRATEWGDDVDRPLRKSNGDWTYFAADIAYHLDKYRRGFNQMIDVFGADHGGYVKRMVAATRAISNDEADLTIRLCQMVNLFDGGEPVKMSKRAGTFVTLRDLVDRVGKDVVRFMLLTRKNEAQLDFDFARVLEQSKDNPVFYVQYAHARCCSVFRNAERDMPRLDMSRDALQAAELGRLNHPEELALIRLMASWPRQVEQAAEAAEPHRLSFYLYDLASAFHGFWTRGRDAEELRFIQTADAELTQARLALVEGVRTVIRSGLEVLGVTPVEEMR